MNKMKKIYKILFWLPISIICIPLDYLSWNILMSWTFGYCSYSKCVRDSRELFLKLYHSEKLFPWSV